MSIYITDTAFNDALNNADEDSLINMLHDLLIRLSEDKNHLDDYTKCVNRVQNNIDKNKDRQLKIKEKLLTHLIKYRKY
jgi:hypothetical protein